jgi:hypothetical protein
VTISWPIVSGYQLQAVTNLSPPAAWSNVSQPAVTNGSQLVVTLPASTKQQFFRLKK